MPHPLDNLFNPQSIAVIGASDKPQSVGMKVLNNLRQGQFKGKLYAVNPKHKRLFDEPCFPTVSDINKAIDLAVITTPATTVLNILQDCGKAGVKSAIVISAGFSEIGAEGKELEQAIASVAKQYHIRMIGPNCLGVMRPHLNMNATFDNNSALSGGIALVSQSGALCAGILDWAIDKRIGFSALISLGNSVDVDFGDVMTFLASDPFTKSILLYIEGVHHARSFMDGLRTAAQQKPVIAIKAGRHNLGSRAALSHTGALIGNDDVFAAALRRAGVVRVYTIEELFTATEMLASNYRVKNNRLAIITNGGGAGVMAADRAAEVEVTLPTLSEKTLQQLNDVLPSNWSKQNPVDIIGDATPERYDAAIQICLQDENIDALLALLVPVAMSNPLKVAEQIIADAKNSKKPIFASWMGKKHVQSARELFSKHNLPNFSTPEKAVTAFSYLARYTENQEFLAQTPAFSHEQHPDEHCKKARAIMEAASKQNRTVLSADESKTILKLFSIPVNESVNASDADQAVSSANKLGYPVVMKINSPDITHKSDANGVILNVKDDEAVRQAFKQLIQNAKNYKSDATILGVAVERMIKTPHDRELMIGVINDPVFGPVISFGAGGVLVEIMQDRALQLPPLNRFLAEKLIHQTRVAKMLDKFRNMPAVNKEKLIETLLHISDLVCELPYIQEMDINPLIINEREVIAVDARIIIKKGSDPFEK